MAQGIMLAASRQRPAASCSACFCRKFSDTRFPVCGRNTCSKGRPSKMAKDFVNFIAEQLRMTLRHPSRLPRGNKLTKAVIARSAATKQSRRDERWRHEIASLRSQ
jgi:hypothetical protein